MGKRFDETFSEVVEFSPDGLYLSRNLFTKEEAIAAFSLYMHLDVSLSNEQVDEAWVRFGPTCWGMREEIGTKMAWFTVEANTKRAQPCWCYV